MVISDIRQNSKLSAKNKSKNQQKAELETIFFWNVHIWNKA